MSNTEQNTSDQNVSLQYKVTINGKELPDEVNVISIYIQKSFNKIPTAELVVYYGSILLDEYVDKQNEDLSIGNDIEIFADKELLFKGVIVKQAISLSNKKSILKLTAKNEAYKLTLTRFNHIFSEKTDSDIIDEIIKKYGLKSDTDSTSYNNETATQYNCTDWDFINIKAELNSLLVFADNDKIIVKKPDAAAEPKEKINGYDSIMDFDAQIDGRTSFSGYKATLWNYNKQEKDEIEEKNSSNDFKQGNLQTDDIAKLLNNDNYNININSQFTDTDLVTEKVKAKIMRNNLSRIIGKTKLYGAMVVNPGEVIEFSGIGDRFNGKAFVSQTEYQFEDGAWSTSLGFGLEETAYCYQYDDINSYPSSEITPATNGLQIGKVVALEGDPIDEERIKISLPCFDGDNAEIWARLSNPDSGNKRGYFFAPEIDDEVVVGFIDENPNNPIVLGALHGSKLPSPQPLSDDNNIKGFYLKSEIKLEFNEEDKIVTLETPGGNKLVLNDKDGVFELCDSNGNKITMDSNGITIKSAGKVTVEATSDMELKGVNIKAEASASLKASGSGNAEVSSSGVMVVKGSLVQIN